MPSVDPAACAIRLLTRRIILDDVFLLVLDPPPCYGSFSERVVGVGVGSARDRWWYLFVSVSASASVVAVEHHPGVVVPVNSNNGYT